jgi:hypothetical protein
MIGAGKPIFHSFVHSLISVSPSISYLRVPHISSVLPPHHSISRHLLLSPYVSQQKKIIQKVETQRTINCVSPIDRTLAYFYLTETEIH